MAAIWLALALSISISILVSSSVTAYFINNLHRQTTTTYHYKYLKYFV